jgi:sugar phosphate isomerase/epimerase
MIYVSSSCVKSSSIRDIVEILVRKGISNIELSGGTEFYDGLYDDIINLKEKYKLNLIIHNYFPPPKEHFVLNLASSDKTIFEKSIMHYKKSIQFAIELRCPVYGLHAGFFVNPSVDELGKSFSVKCLFDKKNAIKQFINGFEILNELFNDKIKLYIENNVTSEANFQQHKVNICMLTCFVEYKELKKQIDFNLLLDLGHLMVSANTLGLSFEQEFYNLIDKTDYIHLSSNDGKSDMNLLPEKKSFIYRLLKDKYTTKKNITLEIYDNVDKVSSLYEDMQKWN